MSIETVQKLCKDYGFIYENWFGKTKIKSRNDTWFVKWNGDNPRLYHENKLRNTRSGFGMHFQREFSNIKNMMVYIADHDTKLLRYTRKTQHFKDLLNQVHNELADKREYNYANV